MKIDDAEIGKRIYGSNGQTPPIKTTLGGEFMSLADNAIEIAYAGTTAFLNPAGHVQGGMLSAMLDDVTATLVTSTLAEGERCATLSLNTTFLRPASTGRLLGRATLVRRGRGVCNANGELWQDDRLVATASAVCMIVAR
ncbi:PaaI family thioesterase [Paraburkholderia diazotrophica]|uniref:PaaI family thioesterase n=1 Tax=Paraburkholderia diazotrophica TaxID=667676 RepID=UPI00317B0F49